MKLQEMLSNSGRAIEKKTKAYGAKDIGHNPWPVEKESKPDYRARGS